MVRAAALGVRRAVPADQLMRGCSSSRHAHRDRDRERRPGQTWSREMARATHPPPSMIGLVSAVARPVGALGGHMRLRTGTGAPRPRRPCPQLEGARCGKPFCYRPVS